MFQLFHDIGRDLFVAGLITSHGGNMSVRLGDRICITRRGAMLGRLKAEDLVETGLEQDDAKATHASSELVVHRAIYRNTRALAVVHTHPIHATALSLVEDVLVPVDSEGSHLIHRVPVAAAARTVGSAEVAEVAEVLPPLLREHRIALLRGHGAFAVGQSLEEAFMVSSSLEASAQILSLLRGYGYERVREYQSGADQFERW